MVLKDWPVVQFVWLDEVMNREVVRMIIRRKEDDDICIFE